MFAHLFTVRQRMFTELQVDAFLVHDLSDPHSELLAMGEAVEELSCMPPEATKKGEALMSNVQGIMMRLRFNTDMYPHLLRINSPVKLEREELEFIIQNYPKDTLEQKLKEMILL